jgi:hypothetical protein
MPPDTVTPTPGTVRTNRTRRRMVPRPPDPAASISRQRVGAARFAQSLLHLGRPSIERLVAQLDARRTSADDDVAWWEATTALNRALRRRATGHEAAMAAHLASQAILAAATRTDLALTPDVLALARSAGEVARVLTAGDFDTTGAGYLIRGWEDLLRPPADSPITGTGSRESLVRRRSS